MKSVRRTSTAALVLVLLVAASVLGLAAAASPAHAFGEWAHDGAAVCADCHTGGTGPATDAGCRSCHGSDFLSYPGRTCWSCHYPGEDTSSLSSPGTACSQECHLYRRIDKDYTQPYTHGDDPHRGSQGSVDACLDCHSASTGVFNPGESPHHSGQETGFSACGACHSGYQKHANSRACSSCHRQAEAYHLYTANSPGFRSCASCHAMRHAGKSVSSGRCATCHKGGGSGPAARAQHARSITRKFVCSSCHSQRAHASAVRKSITCRTCHKGRFHAAQARVANSTCLSCHSWARAHSVGYACVVCHRGVVHKARP